MNSEAYLNHPNFGLLFRLCLASENQELFTTLYAQRLFFVVTFGAQDVRIEPVSRADARILLENRLRVLRRSGQTEEYQQLQAIHKQTFS
jgi:PII interaction protein X